MQQKRDPFRQANRARLEALDLRWRRLECDRQILKTQIGFASRSESAVSPCQGCANYHGKAYGMSEARQALVCAIHPFGWQQSSTCPDWYPQKFEVKDVELEG